MLVLLLLAAAAANTALAEGAATSVALPERPLFRLFGAAQGMPSSTVYKLALDRDNRLWVATVDGLARYDGVGFRIWRHDPSNPHSLPGNDVQDVLVDRDERVWLALQDGGIARYEPAHDGFHTWRHDPGDAGSLPDDRIWALAGDGAGGVFAGGYRTGLVRLHGDGRIQVWRHDPDDPGSLCNDIILSLAPDADGGLWVGTARGLCQMRPGRGFRTLALAGRADRPGPPMVTGLRSDGRRLWASTNAGLRVLYLDQDPPVATPALQPPPALADVRGNASLAEPDGTVWFASGDGIRRWQPADGTVQVYPARPGRALALPVPNFFDVVRDRDGNLWFASEGGGLAQLPRRWRSVRVFLPEPDQADGLPHGHIRFLGAAGDGRLLMALQAGEGAVELDPATGSTRRWFVQGDGRRQPDRTLMALLRDRRGRLWVGNAGHLSRYHPDTGAFDRIDRASDGRPLPAPMARRMLERDDGTILVAFGGGGLAVVDSDSLVTRVEPLGGDAGLPCTEVNDIRLDPAQAAWMACAGGILRLDPGAERIIAVDGAPRDVIDGLAFAPDGSLWVHRLGHLEQFRVDGTGRLQRIGAVDGRGSWPGFRAGGVLVDADGVVWVTSPRGLYSYEPRHGRITRYDQDDGLASAEFSRVPPVALGPHQLAAGTSAGPVLVDTRLLRAPLPRPRLRWHEASVLRDGRRLALDPGAGPLHLHHDDRDLRVSVRLDSLSKPAAHRYRFVLDHDQRGAGEQPALLDQGERQFQQLPGGAHHLEVTALASDQQPAVNALEQRIVVDLPPWRRAPAMAAYALLLLLAAWTLRLAWQRRLQRLQALAVAEQNRRWAERGNAAKTRFLAAVGHEIRTPMAGLLGMNALLLDSPLDGRQRHYARCVGQAGEHMLALVNDLLDLSRIEAGKLELDPGPVDLPVLLDELLADVEAAAEGKGLRLGLRIAEGTPLAVVADGKRLKQIVLNFLANAIKFTPAGRVRLLVSASDAGHVFAVEDDGPGLSDTVRRQLFERYCQDQTGGSNGGSGLGLAIARELATVMGGTVGADDREHGGSRFWLRVMLASAGGTVAGVPDLPLLLLVDPDPVRADDLVESLAALGARVRHLDVAASPGTDRPGRGSALKAAPAPVPAPPARGGAIALSAAATAHAAEAQLARRGLERLPRVLSLPLGADPPPARPHQRVLSGPWQPAAVLAACRSLWHDQGAVRPARSPNDDLAGMRLLLVEDDPILREVLATRLTERGARVAAVEHGLAALARLGDDPAAFDAVLLDLDLPHLDGLRLLELLHARAGLPVPPTVVITARQQPDDQARCRAAGAAGFFRKPVDIDALAQRLLALRTPGSGRLARAPAEASVPPR